MEQYCFERDGMHFQQLTELAARERREMELGQDMYKPTNVKLFREKAQLKKKITHHHV